MAKQILFLFSTLCVTTWGFFLTPINEWGNNIEKKGGIVRRIPFFILLAFVHFFCTQKTKYAIRSFVVFFCFLMIQKSVSFFVSKKINSFFLIFSNGRILKRVSQQKKTSVPFFSHIEMSFFPCSM